MSRASNLYRLQELDRDLDRSQNRVKEIKVTLEDNKDVLRYRRSLDEADEVLKTARTVRSAAEHTVATQREKIEQTEKKLYSGLIRNPKELQDLQQEAESLKRFLATLEDRLLEAMIGLDDAAQQQAMASENLTRVEEAHADLHKDLTQEYAELEAKISRYTAEREAALENVNGEDLALYQDLRERKGGVPIALVQEGNCGICGLNLARSVQQATGSGTELIRCNQCGRILYAG
jgi:predicted  nucleic acid-binding Zn-ribbon protein